MLSSALEPTSKVTQPHVYCLDEVTRRAARVLAMVHIAKLCANDISELLHMPGQKTANILKALVERDLAFVHTINGVQCYVQTDGEVHIQFTDLALGALSA